MTLNVTNQGFTAMATSYSVAMNQGESATTATIYRRSRIPTSQAGSRKSDTIVASNVPVIIEVVSARGMENAERAIEGKTESVVVHKIMMPTQMNGQAIDIDARCYIVTDPYGTEPSHTFYIRGFGDDSGPGFLVLASLEV